jgi:hypothetical protein
MAAVLECAPFGAAGRNGRREQVNAVIRRRDGNWSGGLRRRPLGGGARATLDTTVLHHAAPAGHTQEGGSEFLACVPVVSGGHGTGVGVFERVFDRIFDGGRT